MRVISRVGEVKGGKGEQQCGQQRAGRWQREVSGEQIGGRRRKRKAQKDEPVVSGDRARDAGNRGTGEVGDGVMSSWRNRRELCQKCLEEAKDLFTKFFAKPVAPNRRRTA